MTDMRPRIERLATIVSDTRREITGSAMQVPETSSWRVASFDDLVSDVYMWFYEGWGREVSYLCRNAVKAGPEAGGIRRFNSILNDLRTSRQHANTPDADRSMARWLHEMIGTKNPAGGDDWDRACMALLEQCEQALEALVALAKVIKNDPGAMARWRDAVLAETQTSEADMVTIVLGDLGVSVDKGTQEFLVRQAKTAWSRRRQAMTATDLPEQEIEHVIERLVVGNLMPPLPCAYNDVLQAVGVEPGDRDAMGALLLAHGAAASLEYATKDEFLDLIEERFGGWFAK